MGSAVKNTEIDIFVAGFWFTDMFLFAEVGDNWISIQGIDVPPKKQLSKAARRRKKLRRAYLRRMRMRQVTQISLN